MHRLEMRNKKTISPEVLGRLPSRGWHVTSHSWSELVVTTTVTGTGARYGPPGGGTTPTVIDGGIYF